MDASVGMPQVLQKRRFESQNVVFKSSEFAQRCRDEREKPRTIVVRVGPEKKGFVIHPLIMAVSSPFFGESFLAGEAGEFDDSEPDNSDPAVAAKDNSQTELEKSGSAIVQKNESGVEIDDLDFGPTVMELVLNYMHNGAFEIEVSDKPEQNIVLLQGLLFVAKGFQLEDVEQMVLQFLTEQLRPENCLDLLDFATSKGLQDTRDRVEGYINDNFEAVIKLPQFEELEPSKVLKFISQFSRKSTPPHLIFLAVVQWVEESIEGRDTYLPQLMREVELGKIFDARPDFLEAAFAKGTILERNAECLEMYSKLVNHKACQSQNELNNQSIDATTSATLSEQCQNSNGEMEQEMQISSLQLPMSPEPAASDQPESENNLPGTSRHLRSDLKERQLNKAKRARIAQPKKAEDQIQPEAYAYNYPNYALLYLHSLNGEQKLYEYNFRTKRTVSLYDINSVRKSSALVYYDDKIFHIGGTTNIFNVDNDLCEPSGLVNTYDRGQSRTMTGAALLEPRKHFAAVICLGFLYVVGGSQFQSQTHATDINCVERLSLEGDESQWEVVDGMKYARGAHDAVILNDKIYVIGGTGSSVSKRRANDSVDLASVEMYNPELDPENEKEDIWEAMPDMNQARAYVKAAVMNGKIYAVGGSVRGEPGSRLYRNLTSVEVFNPERSTWTLVANLNQARSPGIVIADDNLLYAIGGNSQIQQTLEVYDERTNKWTMLPWPKNLHRNVEFPSATAMKPHIIPAQYLNNNVRTDCYVLLKLSDSRFYSAALCCD